MNTRIAAIDVGSNAIRMVEAHIRPSGEEIQRSMQRYALRLGEDVFACGEVSEPTLQALVNVFKTMASVFKEHNITHYKAVATSALRDARNQTHVLQTLHQQSGIALQVISGEDESRLARKALVRSLGYVPPSTLLMDLGGGSLEIERAGRRPGVSLPLGVVRLLQTHPGVAGKCSKKRYTALMHSVLQELERTQKLTPSAPLAVGTGGNLSLLSEQLPCTGFNYPAINVAQLDDFVHTVRALSIPQRMQRYHLRRDRADVLLAALAVIQAVVEFYEIKTFLTPPTGLRDTLLWQQIPAPALWKTAKEQLAATHAHNHLRALETIATLFNALSPVHGLWPQALGVCAAEYALLHTPSSETLRASYHTLQPSKHTQAIAHAIALFAHNLQQAQPSGRLRVCLLQDPITLSIATEKPVPSNICTGLSKVLGRPFQMR